MLASELSSGHCDRHESKQRREKTLSKPDNPVQVLAKMDAVFEVLAAERELSAADLAERIDEPRSSVYRLLSSLQQLSLVEAGALHGTYKLGIRLLRLGGAVQERLDLRIAAAPVMERMHDETGNTIFLCVRRGTDAVCVERLDGRRVTTLALSLGGSLPLHAGAGPRVLLAYEPRSFWHEYLARDSLEGFTPSTPTTAETLIPALESVRREGISVSDEDVTPGIAALGTPVFDRKGQLCGSLSVSGLRESIMGSEEERIRRLVIEGGEEASRSLGYVAPLTATAGSTKAAG